MTDNYTINKNYFDKVEEKISCAQTFAVTTIIVKKVLFDIVCIFLNGFFWTSEHAAELKNPIPAKPILFMKPPSSYLANGGQIEVSRLFT